MEKRQLAMVLDLNKCIGCHSCSIACKQLWTGDDGREAMWWNSVNTMPGRGTPRDWEDMGGGFRAGAAQPGRIPTRKEFGEAWDFNHDEVFFSGRGGDTHSVCSLVDSATSSFTPGSDCGVAISPYRRRARSR